MGQKFSSDEVYDTLRGEDSVCTVYSFLRFLDGSGTWGDYHVCDEETNSVRDHHGRRGRAAPGGRGRVTSAGHATRGDAEAAHDRDGVDEVAGGSSPAGAAQDVDMRRPVVRASTQEEDEVHAYRQSQLKQLIGQVIPKLLHFYVLYSLDQGGASVFRRADVAFFVSHYINSAQYTYACVRKEALHLFFKASAPGGGGSALQSASRGGNQAGGRAAGASAAAGAAPATTDAAAFVSSSAAAAASPSAAVNGGAASHPPRFGSAAAGGTSSSEGSSAAATTGAAPAASSATSTAHAGAPSLAPAAARAGQQTRVAGMSQGAVAYVQIGAGSLARSASGVRSCSGAVGSASRHAGRGGAPGAAAAAVTLAAAAPGSAAPASGHAGAAAAGAAAAPSRSGPGAPLPAPAASQQSQTARQHGAAVVGSGGSPGPASAARPTCGTLPLITPALITRTRNLAKWLCAMVIVRRPPSRGARKPRLIGPSKSGTAASTGGEFLGASAGPPTLTLREVRALWDLLSRDGLHLGVHYDAFLRMLELGEASSAVAAAEVGRRGGSQPLTSDVELSAATADGEVDDHGGSKCRGGSTVAGAAITVAPSRTAEHAEAAPTGPAEAFTQRFSLLAAEAFTQRYLLQIYTHFLWN